MKDQIPRRTFRKCGAFSAVAVLVLPARVSAGAAPRKVIVPGAGLAGLAAGDELTKAGHEVIVLEAQARAGGARVTFGRTGAVETLGADFNAAEGRIHSAGEHCSIYASWMNGALESGKRAARAVDEAARRVAKVEVENIR